MHSKITGAEAIIATRHPGYLQDQEGSLVVTKTWAKLLLTRMNFVNKKVLM